MNSQTFSEEVPLSVAQSQVDTAGTAVKKTIRLKLGKEKIVVQVNGRDVKKALGDLYERLITGRDVPRFLGGGTPSGVSGGISPASRPVSTSGSTASSQFAAGELAAVIKPSENAETDAGFAAVDMFLSLFGEEITEKLLLLCQKHPGITMKKLNRLIRRGLYPLAARQTRFEDRRGVRKYL